jgi:hypothetical protein
MFRLHLAMKASAELTRLEQQQSVPQLRVADPLSNRRAPPYLRRQIGCERLDISQRPSCRDSSQHQAVQQGDIRDPPALSSTSVQQACEIGIGESAKDPHLRGGLSILLTQYSSFEKLPDERVIGASPAV